MKAYFRRFTVLLLLSEKWVIFSKIHTRLRLHKPIKTWKKTQLHINYSNILRKNTKKNILRGRILRRQKNMENNFRANFQNESLYPLYIHIIYRYVYITDIWIYYYCIYQNIYCFQIRKFQTLENTMLSCILYNIHSLFMYNTHTHTPIPHIPPLF